MARIRSIKPDFFTSEVIASLPLSARLTFIGLWTYVDDNGVGLDNERLIVAAIWPLEDNLTEALERTREDLRRLSGEGLVVRYDIGRRRYIRVTSWDEHQKVSHPGKPRYPLPPAPLTSANAARESLRNGSGKPRETLGPEQGAGSREQGAGKSSSSAVNSNVEGPEPAAPDDPSWTELSWLGDAQKRLGNA